MMKSAAAAAAAAPSTEREAAARKVACTIAKLMIEAAVVLIGKTDSARHTISVHTASGIQAIHRPR